MWKINRSTRLLKIPLPRDLEIFFFNSVFSPPSPMPKLCAGTPAGPVPEPWQCYAVITLFFFCRDAEVFVCICVNAEQVKILFQKLHSN